MIIVSVILVAGIILIFLLYKFKVIEIPIPIRGQLPPAQEFIGKCASDAASDAVNIMLPQGGYLAPRNFREYGENPDDSSKIAYLCYNENYYLPCIKQEPSYIEHLEDETEEYITPIINDCFLQLKQSYIDSGYDVDLNPQMNLEVNLKPKRVEINITRFFKIQKGAEVTKLDKFDSLLPSPIYDFGRIAEEITNQEAEFCNFETGGYSLLYPDFDVRVSKLSDGIKIYRINETFSAKELKFAVRSCVLAAGR